MPILEGGPSASHRDLASEEGEVEEEKHVVRMAREVSCRHITIVEKLDFEDGQNEVLNYLTIIMSANTKRRTGRTLDANSSHLVDHLPWQATNSTGSEAIS